MLFYSCLGESTKTLALFHDYQSNYVCSIRSNNYYYYLDPTEKVVHGTYGVKESSVFCSWAILTDFVTEIFSGVRGFGHPTHKGSVPR